MKIEIDKEKYIEALKQKASSKKEKIDFEFQDIGIQLVNLFGKEYSKRIWPLFYKPEYPLQIIKEAFFAYQKQPVKSFIYFIGILNTKAGKKKKK